MANTNGANGIVLPASVFAPEAQSTALRGPFTREEALDVLTVLLEEVQTHARAETAPLQEQLRQLQRMADAAEASGDTAQAQALASEIDAVIDRIDAVFKDRFLPQQRAIDRVGKSIDPNFDDSEDEEDDEEQSGAFESDAPMAATTALADARQSALVQRAAVLRDEIAMLESELPSLQQQVTAAESALAAAAAAFEERRRSGRVFRSQGTPLQDARLAAARSNLQSAVEQLDAARVEQAQIEQALASFPQIGAVTVGPLAGNAVLADFVIDGMTRTETLWTVLGSIAIAILAIAVIVLSVYVARMAQQLARQRKQQMRDIGQSSLQAQLY